MPTLTSTALVIFISIYSGICAMKASIVILSFICCHFWNRWYHSCQTPKTSKFFFSPRFESEKKWVNWSASFRIEQTIGSLLNILNHYKNDSRRVRSTNKCFFSTTIIVLYFQELVWPELNVTHNDSLFKFNHRDFQTKQSTILVKNSFRWSLESLKRNIRSIERLVRIVFWKSPALVR